MQIAAIVIGIIVLLCLRPVQNLIGEVYIFFLDHAPGVGVVIALVGILALTLFLLGIPFWTVYGGMISTLFVIGTLSIWITPLRWVFSTILILGVVIYLGGKVFPPMENYITTNFPAYTEWRNNEKKLVNNKLEERSISIKKELLSSEVSKGTFGTLTESSLAYDETGTTIDNLQLLKGQCIMSLGLQSKAQSEDPAGSGTEGMAYVLIANEHGDFVKSRSALVPIRKIKWEPNKKEAAKKVEPKKLDPSPAETVFVPTARLQFKQTRRSGENVYFLVKSIHRTKETLSIECEDGLQLTGTGFGDQQYAGRWTQGNNNSGHFTLKFIDANSAPGGTIGQKEGDNLLELYPL